MQWRGETSTNNGFDHSEALFVKHLGGVKL